MYSSDHPEQIKVTITEDDLELARLQSEAAKASKLRARPLTATQDSRNFDNSRTETISQSINQEVARTSRMLPANSQTVRRRVTFP